MSSSPSSSSEEISWKILNLKITSWCFSSRITGVYGHGLWASFRPSPRVARPSWSCNKSLIHVDSSKWDGIKVYTGFAESLQTRKLLSESCCLPCVCVCVFSMSSHHYHHRRRRHQHAHHSLVQCCFETSLTSLDCPLLSRFPGETISKYCQQQMCKWGSLHGIQLHVRGWE